MDFEDQIQKEYEDLLMKGRLKAEELGVRLSIFKEKASPFIKWEMEEDDWTYYYEVYLTYLATSLKPEKIKDWAEYHYKYREYEG